MKIYFKASLLSSALNCSILSLNVYPALTDMSYYVHSTTQCNPSN
jgi:hypothetical protein